MAAKSTVTFYLKEGVDPVKWEKSLREMLRHTHVEEPDDEIENRSFVIDSVDYEDVEHIDDPSS